jgi:hypothetical protein
MRTALVFLIIGILTLCILYWQFQILITPKTVEFNFSNAYIIIDLQHVILLTGVFLLTLFSVGGLLGTGFRSPFFIILFLLCAAAIGYLAWQINTLLTS